MVKKRKMKLMLALWLVMVMALSGLQGMVVQADVEYPANQRYVDGSKQSVLTKEITLIENNGEKKYEKYQVKLSMTGSNGEERYDIMRTVETDKTIPLNRKVLVLMDVSNSITAEMFQKSANWLSTFAERIFYLNEGDSYNGNKMAIMFFAGDGTTNKYYFQSGGEDSPVFLDEKDKVKDNLDQGINAIRAYLDNKTTASPIIEALQKGVEVAGEQGCEQVYLFTDFNQANPSEEGMLTKETSDIFKKIKEIKDDATTGLTFGIDFKFFDVSVDTHSQKEGLDIWSLSPFDVYDSPFIPKENESNFYFSRETDSQDVKTGEGSNGCALGDIEVSESLSPYVDFDEGGEVFFVTHRYDSRANANKEVRYTLRKSEADSTENTLVFKNNPEGGEVAPNFVDVIMTYDKLTKKISFSPENCDSSYVFVIGEKDRIDFIYPIKMTDQAREKWTSVPDKEKDKKYQEANGTDEIVLAPASSGSFSGKYGHLSASDTKFAGAMFDAYVLKTNKKAGWTRKKEKSGSFPEAVVRYGHYKNIDIEKKWQNSSGAEVLPPVDEITVQLFKNDNPEQTLKLTKDKAWKGEFIKLPGEDTSGNPYVYSVKELDGKGKVVSQGEEFYLNGRNFTANYSVSGNLTTITNKEKVSAPTSSVIPTPTPPVKPDLEREKPDPAPKDPKTPNPEQRTPSYPVPPLPPVELPPNYDPIPELTEIEEPKIPDISLEDNIIPLGENPDSDIEIIDDKIPEGSKKQRENPELPKTGGVSNHFLRFLMIIIVLTLLVLFLKIDRRRKKLS